MYVPSSWELKKIYLLCGSIQEKKCMCPVHEEFKKSTCPAGVYKKKKCMCPVHEEFNKSTCPTGVLLFYYLIIFFRFNKLLYSIFKYCLAILEITQIIFFIINMKILKICNLRLLIDCARDIQGD
jgi:hypothetical protein